VLLAAGAGLFATGVSAGRRGRAALGAGLFLFTILFFAFLSFWGEHLWFAELGYSDRFWTAVLAKGGLGLAGAVFGGAAVFVLTQRPASRFVRCLATLVGALLGGVWGVASWGVFLRYLNAVEGEARDPILGRSEGFYLFSLPFYDALYGLLLTVTLVAVAASVIFATLRFDAADLEPPAPPGSNGELEPPGEPGEPDQESPPPARLGAKSFRSLFLSVGALAVVLAWGRYLAVFHLMYSDLGAVTGPGWIDVHVRLPGYYVSAAVTLLVGLALLLPPAANALYRRLGAAGDQSGSGLFRLGSVLVGVVGATWFVALFALPALFQWLKVLPNEISLERPYLAYNIAFTRQGFRLDRAESARFEVSPDLTRETVAENQDVLSEVRLWDPGAIADVFQQFQAIRLYYNTTEVDVARYTIDGRYRQVLLAAREMDSSNLPRDHQTFVNQRFKYTHGYGVTMASVSDFTLGGLPNFLVKDIPPVASFPELEVTRPEIYYGELTRQYVVANSAEPEFDYPSGEENVYTRYAGRGGVPVEGFWRKFLFGWKVGGTDFLMSTYPTKESRVMFRREIRERVQEVAPFLTLDHDPYSVVVDGALFWIIDAYTTSRYYPYSEPFSPDPNAARWRGENAAESPGFAAQLRGQNYVRNSVKAVVDAYHGTVSLYVFEPEDPVVQVWSKIFPGLLKPRAEMPAGLLAHVRYPEDYLLAQGLVYARYHMTDPEVFYNQEDLWTRATESYKGEVRPVNPYYVMWKPAGAQKAEFTLIQPFTPKNRQVLIGWIAGMSDGDNYGRLLTYRFPKDTRVLGPQQMDTKIDQDPVLTARLGLWSRGESSVIRGNALVLPIGDTLLYVEPIFIQARTAAYPELRVVVVMHNDRMSYASTFEEALQSLLGAETGGALAPHAAILGLDRPIVESIQRANEAFESYLRLSAEKRFEEAARALESLNQSLQSLQETQSIPTIE
ncbi:MAG: UPF0182 family protein, partial [Byssovorax sp.]